MYIYAYSKNKNTTKAQFRFYCSQSDNMKIFLIAVIVD